MILLLKVTFWFSLLFVLYTYFGYPLLLIMAAKLRSKPVSKKEITPFISMIIPAYNEERNIGGKLENTLELNYPEDSLEIIVVSDGSSDRTDDIVKEFRMVKLIRMSERGGKAHALNAAVAEARGDIIVFSDARQMYDKGAIRELANNFSDAAVGAVSGEVHLVNQDGGGVGKGISMYWRYETLLRKLEGRLYSTAGAAGAIYAIRKELYQPIPDDTILDDFVIPMQIFLSGYRVICEERAKAYDIVADTARAELTRKIRTLCGNYQAFFRMRQLFNPFRNRILFQFISHKVFRLLVPFALFLMLVSSAFLVFVNPYRIMLILQVLMYISAFIGHYLSRAKPSSAARLFGIPYTFVVLNYAAVAGLYRYITRTQHSTWEKAFDSKDSV